MPTAKETREARNREALAKLPPPFLPPGKSLAREWRPSGPMQRELVPLVLVPAMRYYARLTMGKPARVTVALHAFRTPKVLMWWLRDEWTHGKLIPPAATAAAWWALEDEERSALEILVARDGVLPAVTQGAPGARPGAQGEAAAAAEDGGLWSTPQPQTQTQLQP